MVSSRIFGRVVCALAGMAAIAAAARGAEPTSVQAVLLELIEQADVPARDSGVIESIAVREGAVVRTGDAVVQLDAAELRLDVDRAQLEVNIARRQSQNDVDVRFAKKSLEVAQSELQRALDSVKDYAKSVSETELDRLKLGAERARLEIEQAEHVLTVAGMTADLKQNALETARAKLARQTIRAPLDGVVAQVYRRCGEWVEPGQQVVRIVRMDRLRAEGFVPLTALGAVSVGARVELLMQSGEEAGTAAGGKLVFIDPEVDPVNGQVRVWAEIENEGMHLKPGMRGTMLISRLADSEPEGGPSGRAGNSDSARPQ
ncbi:MAG: efflux RND transporter periplasmic adaptor subunit [Thermoguttaceae bacterium]